METLSGFIVFLIAILLFVLVVIARGVRTVRRGSNGPWNASAAIA
jgi:hypothetical protein